MTINLPSIFDTVRITTSLERGLITGTVFGFGLFLIRIITERFPTANAFLRVILGTLAGTIGLNVAMFIFHVLFIKTTPQGFLITLGCVLIALTFAIGGLIRSSLIKMMLSSLSIFMAIVGTWLIHVNLTNSPVELTPLFKYDYAWPLSQVLLAAFSVSLLIGVLGNLIPLAIKDEEL